MIKLDRFRFLFIAIIASSIAAITLLAIQQIVIYTKLSNLYNFLENKNIELSIPEQELLNHWFSEINKFSEFILLIIIVQILLFFLLKRTINRHDK